MTSSMGATTIDFVSVAFDVSKDSVTRNVSESSMQLLDSLWTNIELTMAERTACLNSAASGLSLLLLVDPRIMENRFSTQS